MKNFNSTFTTIEQKYKILNIRKLPKNIIYLYYMGKGEIYNINMERGKIIIYNDIIKLYSSNIT